MPNDTAPPQTAAPMSSYRSGLKPSTTIPQASEPATKTAVGGEEAAEVWVGLDGGGEPVQAERDDAGADPEQAAMLTYALPDQPGAADLRDCGQDE